MCFINHSILVTYVSSTIDLTIDIQVQNINSKSGRLNVFKNAMLSWQCLLHRKRWYRCLDKVHQDLLPLQWIWSFNRIMSVWFMAGKHSHLTAERTHNAQSQLLLLIYSCFGGTCSLVRMTNQSVGVIPRHNQYIIYSDNYRLPCYQANRRQHRLSLLPRHILS